jgi:mono/diheme cytochrome c family protein
MTNRTTALRGAFVGGVLLSVCVAAGISRLAAAPAEGLFSEAQTKHGAVVYREKCSACHGSTLDGGQEAPALKGEEFWAEWEHQTARMLYSRIISSMPPDGPGTLPEKDVIDLVAHIVNVNSVPLGSRSVEAPAELNALKLERAR